MSAVKIAEDYRETVDICHLEVPTRTTFQFMKTNIYKSTYSIEKWCNLPRWKTGLYKAALIPKAALIRPYFCILMTVCTVGHV